MRRLLLLFVVLVVASVGLALFDGAKNRARPIAPQYEAAPNEATVGRRSIVALLADPTRHHQRRVAVAGFLVLEFEHAALYLDQTSQRAGLQENGVWVDPPLDVKHPTMKALSRQYVVVEGTFNANEKGYGTYAGTLQNVRSIRLTYTEQQYRRAQIGWAEAGIFMAIQRLLVYAAILTIVAMIGLGLFRVVRRLR